MGSRSPEAAFETVALVAMLRAGARPLVAYADMLEETGSAQAILEEEHGLLATELIEDAAREIASWHEQGIALITLLDDGYPENLRAVHDRPPLLFVAGRLEPCDARSVAVIGSRRASPPGLDRARAITSCLAAAGYTVVSGLAAGIDTAAHLKALEQGSRTIGVIGTGLEHAYPPQNAGLQQRLAANGAVVSRFWPEAGPARQSFPIRNALMSGLTLATIVVEATHMSGTRTQIRAALDHGRPVILASTLLDQPWAREVASRPGVEVVRSIPELEDVLARITSSDTLVA